MELVIQLPSILLKSPVVKTDLPGPTGISQVTATTALRLSSPVIFHSKPRDNRVGRSMTKAPGVTALSSARAGPQSAQTANSAAKSQRILVYPPGRSLTLTRFSADSSRAMSIPAIPRSPVSPGWLRRSASCRCCWPAACRSRAPAAPRAPCRRRWRTGWWFPPACRRGRSWPELFRRRGWAGHIRPS